MMELKPYYTVYENRYQKVYEAGAERWGHSPDDEGLITALKAWVEENRLKGKRVIEFACGEGGAGVILSRLGCIYHGIDIAPSAVEKARAALKSYPNTKVSMLDMVKQQIDEKYDAALDVMGLHMLVTDSDRANYLNNAFSCLKSGAPMLFYRESYRVNAYEGPVASFDDWLAITGEDYKTPEQRFAKCGDKEVEVYIPLVPARARNREGYMREMTEAGFKVDAIIEMETNNEIVYSASIYVHKP